MTHRMEADGRVNGANIRLRYPLGNGIDVILAHWEGLRGWLVCMVDEEAGDCTDGAYFADQLPAVECYVARCDGKADPTRHIDVIA